MNRVLYETGYMSLSGFEFVIAAFVMALFLYLCLKGLIKVHRRLIMKGKRSGVLSILERAVMFIMIMVIVAVFWEYFNIVIKYKIGHYIEIEGVVENYSFAPGRQGTTFIVDGVEFCCPSSDWGYFPKSENNRVIKENGQHLRIRYIVGETYGNVIVYIEQLKEEVH